MKTFTLFPLMILIGSAIAQTSNSEQGTQTPRTAPVMDSKIFQGIPNVTAAMQNFMPSRPTEEQLMAPSLLPVRVTLPKTVPSEEYVPDLQEANSTECGERIGYVKPAFEGIMQAAVWTRLPNGSHVCHIELESKDAGGLRINFKNILAAEGMELRVYAPGENAVHGPYTFPMIWMEDNWWTPTIFGETIGLEFYLPAGKELPKELPTIEQILYVNCAWSPNATLACYNDISCNGGWQTEADGVMRYTMVTTGGGCSTCTGYVVNRSNEDLSPLMISANHCGISNQTVASSMEFFWRYQTPSCGGAAPNPNTVSRTMGALVLKDRANEDNTLLGLYSPPPGGTAFLGWDANSNWANNDPIAGIHHPGGSWKRISFGTVVGNSVRNFTGVGNRTVWDMAYTNGVTEGGSSGSPVFDSARRARGPLTGGPNVCPNPPSSPSTSKYYGRFDLAFPDLGVYMNNPASPVYVNGNYGGFERGTNAEPFNSIFEAVFCVRSRDTVWIVAGNYGAGNHRYDSQPASGNNTTPNLQSGFRIWRPMTLRTLGGVVRIGN